MWCSPSPRDNHRRACSFSRRAASSRMQWSSCLPARWSRQWPCLDLRSPTLQNSQAPKPRRDSRSKEAAAYRAWYKTPIWKAIRLNQLSTHPLCRMCEAEGRIVAASVCDHINPHRGAWDAFVSGPFQSLCKPCHDRHAQRRDRTGHETKVIGLDGWPVGPDAEAPGGGEKAGI